MEERHLDGVMEIEKASFPTPWSRQMFTDELSRDFSDALVALTPAGDTVLGFAVNWTVAGESHLLNIAVAPACRGRGVGRALLRACLQRAARAGSELMRLEVRAGNDAAIGLYRDEGFVFAGIRRRYYSDTGEDAVLMDRPIDRSDAR